MAKATTAAVGTVEHDAVHVMAVRVWDPLVRVGHWLLVLATGLSLWTGFLGGARAVDLHVWAGTTVALVVVVRVCWGLLGGRYARFSGFVPGPRDVLHHLSAFGQTRTAARIAGRYLGHNPVGAVAVLAMLTLCVLLVVTGTVSLGGIFWRGSLHALTTFDTGWRAVTFHRWLAFAMLVMIAGHVAGVLLESWRSGENLTGAMVTGRKLRRRGDSIPPDASMHPVAVLAMTVSGVAAVAVLPALTAAHLREGAPTPVAGTPYAAVCVDCHAAFHPSLLPAASWAGLMVSLGDHFGEDASLDPRTASTIAAYLAANAADVTDTKPGHVFRSVAADQPFRITAAPFWTRTHVAIPDATFAMSSVGSRANCPACHADAADGWFYPGRIHIPSDPQGPPT